MAEPAEMDAAAEQAKQELIQNMDKWTAKDIANWWGQNYLKSGHKRLGRALLEAVKEVKAN